MPNYMGRRLYTRTTNFTSNPPNWGRLYGVTSYPSRGEVTTARRQGEQEPRPRTEYYGERDLYHAQWEAQVGYQPSYWEHPQRVARYYHALNAFAPGQPTPDWLDRDAITAAYDYMKFRNNDKPWYEWDYLNPEDPAHDFLRSLAPPPPDALWPDEQKKFGPDGRQTQPTTYTPEPPKPI